MSSKTLARAGASLVTRLLSSRLHRSTQSSSNLAAHISANPPAPSFLTGFQAAPPAAGAGWNYLETVKQVSFRRGDALPLRPSFRSFLLGGWGHLPATCCCWGPRSVCATLAMCVNWTLWRMLGQKKASGRAYVEDMKQSTC